MRDLDKPASGTPRTDAEPSELVKKIRAYNYSHADDVENLERELTALRARLEEAEKDAARWRFGCERGFPRREASSVTANAQPRWFMTVAGRNRLHDTPQDAIDSAMGGRDAA